MLQRWSKASTWRPQSGSQGTCICYASAMSDFEDIGRKMPKATDVDSR